MKMAGISHEQLAAITDAEIAEMWKEASDLAKVAARIGGWHRFGAARRRFFFTLMYVRLVGLAPATNDRVSEYA